MGKMLFAPHGIFGCNTPSGHLKNCHATMLPVQAPVLMVRPWLTWIIDESACKSGCDFGKERVTAAFYERRSAASVGFLPRHFPFFLSPRAPQRGWKGPPRDVTRGQLVAGDLFPRCVLILHRRFIAQRPLPLHAVIAFSSGLLE